MSRYTNTTLAFQASNTLATPQAFEIFSNKVKVEENLVAEQSVRFHEGRFVVTNEHVLPNGIVLSHSTQRFSSSDISVIKVEHYLRNGLDVYWAVLPFDNGAELFTWRMDGAAPKSGLSPEEAIAFQSLEDLRRFVDILSEFMGKSERSLRSRQYMEVGQHNQIGSIIGLFQNFSQFNNCYTFAINTVMTAFEADNRKFYAPTGIAKHPFSRVLMFPDPLKNVLKEEGWSEIDPDLINTPENQEKNIVAAYYIPGEDFHFIRRVMPGAWLQCFSGRGVFAAHAHGREFDPRIAAVNSYKYLATFDVPLQPLRIEVSDSCTAEQALRMSDQYAQQNRIEIRYYP